MAGQIRFGLALKNFAPEGASLSFEEIAKVLSTIDLISHGRLVLGAAAGWYEREFEAVGVPFRRRGRVLPGNVELLKRFWTGRAVLGDVEGDDGTPHALQFDVSSVVAGQRRGRELTG